MAGDKESVFCVFCVCFVLLVACMIMIRLQAKSCLSMIWHPERMFYILLNQCGEWFLLPA